MKASNSSLNTSLTVLTQQNTNLQSSNPINNNNTTLINNNSNLSSSSNNSGTNNSSQSNQVQPSISTRLNTGLVLNGCVKLLDENFVWQDQLQDVRINDYS